MSRTHLLLTTLLSAALVAGCSSHSTAKDHQASQQGPNRGPPTGNDPNDPDQGNDPNDPGEGTSVDAGPPMQDGGVPSACAPAPSGWRDMASMPTDMLANFTLQIANAVWTGSEMLMFGYKPTCSKNPMCPGPNEVVAYNPASDSFRLLPTPDFADHLARVGVRSFWTGDSWLLFGGASRPLDGLAYDPKTNSFSMIPLAPIAERGDYATVWSTATHELIVYGGDDMTDGAAYDPHTHSWRPIARSPLTPASTNAASWDGTRMIVGFGVHYPSPSTPMYAYFSDAAAFDPMTNAWTKLDSPPVTPRQVNVELTIGTGNDDGALWGGSVHDIFLDGAFYSEKTGWNAIPSASMLSSVSLNARWSGQGKMWIWGGVIPAISALTFSGDGASFDPSTGVWTKMPDGGPTPRQAAIAVWTGCDAIVFGGGIFKELPGTNAFINGKIFRP